MAAGAGGEPIGQPTEGHPYISRRSRLPVRQKGSQACVGAHVHALCRISEEAAQILRAIGSGPSVVLDHLTNPVGGWLALQPFLEFPLQLALCRLKSHRVIPFAGLPLQAACGAPNGMAGRW